MNNDFPILLAAFAAITLSTKFLPMVWLKNKNLSPKFKAWMNFIPVTIFAALVASDVFFVEDQVSFHLLENPLLIPSLIVLLVSVKTKNLIYAILTGVGSLFLFQVLF